MPFEDCHEGKLEDRVRNDDFSIRYETEKNGCESKQVHVLGLRKRWMQDG